MIKKCSLLLSAVSISMEILQCTPLSVLFVTTRTKTYKSKC